MWQLTISPATGRVAGEVVRLTFGTAVERTPAVSSSGQVVFTSIAENVDVWRLPLDAKTGLANGTIERVTDNAASDQSINTSDDGKTIAFLSSRTGQDEVWIRDVHSGEDRQITYSNARWGRISHDGSALAVSRGGSKPGMDLVPLTNGSASPLCDGCDPGDWSPDGTRLVVRRGSPSRLLVRDLEQHPVVGAGFLQVEPAMAGWSRTTTREPVARSHELQVPIRGPAGETEGARLR